MNQLITGGATLYKHGWCFPSTLGLHPRNWFYGLITCYKRIVLLSYVTYKQLHVHVRLCIGYKPLSSTGMHIQVVRPSKKRSLISRFLFVVSFDSLFGILSGILSHILSDILADNCFNLTFVWDSITWPLISLFFVCGMFIWHLISCCLLCTFYLTFLFGILTDTYYDIQFYLLHLVLHIFCHMIWNFI